MNHLNKTQEKVRVFKYIFLSLSCCILVAIIVTLYFNNTTLQEDLADRSSKSVQPNLSKDYNLTINRSTFKGVSKDLVPYIISADTVSKDLEDNYTLNMIAGEYLIENGNLTIAANSGTMDKDTKVITLEDNVRVTLNNLIFNSQKIKLNLKNQEAYSDDNVEVHFNKSSIKANSFKTKDANNIIEFNGNVESEFIVKTK